MSEPRTPDDLPKTPEEKTGFLAEKNDVPKNTPGDKKGKNTELKDVKPDNGKREKQRNFLISIGVAVVIILAAACAFVFLTPQVATKGDRVSVYYSEAFDNGTVFYSNMNSTNPLVFTLGNSSVLPGFEDEVIGMAVNQEKTVTIPPEKAYGLYNPTLVQTVNRTGPLANISFVTGQTYTIHDKVANTYTTITVLNITPTTITWDANSLMAGQNVTFAIKLDNLTKKR